MCFNTAEGWSRDATEDIAREIKERADKNPEELSPGLQDFIEYQLSLVEYQLSLVEYQLSLD